MDMMPRRGKANFNIADVSPMSLIGRFGADGCVASIVSALTLADHLVAGAGGSTSV